MNKRIQKKWLKARRGLPKPPLTECLDITPAVRHWAREFSKRLLHVDSLPPGVWFKVSLCPKEGHE